MGTIQIDGSTPKLTIGNATAEDATILFDGNAQDFYIALDDSADDLLIGKGSTVGTTPAIAIDENLKVNIPVTTASTSASTGSLTTGGGAGIGADLYVGDDVYLITDSAVLGFGADKDTLLTHTDGTGLTLNSTNKLCFNDASQFVQGSSATVLSIGATDEIDLTATAVDLNGTLDVSGTALVTGVLTTTAATVFTGGFAASAISTITTADNADTLTLISTDADANVGPNVKLYRNSSSPAADDLLGAISFAGEDDGGNDTEYALIDTVIGATTGGSENGRIRMKIQKGGTLSSGLDINADAIIINDDSKDIDFRVESDSSTTMFNLQAVNSNNSAGSIGFNAANADGNFIEATNPQSGVYAAKFISSAASSTIYGMNLLFSGQNPDDNTSQFLVCSDGAAVRMRVYADGDVQNHDNSYAGTSDERIKQQIADASSQWDDLKAVKVRKFKFNSDVADKGDSDALWRLGVVAQELEASSMNGLVKPEVQYQEGDQETKDYLYTEKDKDIGEIPEGKDVGDVKQAKTADVGDIKDYKSVKYSILYMKAIKALQEAETRIETLEAKVAVLEG